MKIRYLKILPLVKKIIKEFSPDIVHAHYASSYGLLGVLSGFHPFIISIWGSDVFDFPKKSFIHKYVLKYNLGKADYILSTSIAMAEEIRLYTDKKIEVTPFGIDLEKFKEFEVESLFADIDIVIGTIKSLEDVYGVEYLIRTFKLLVDKYPHLPLKLLIVGSGSLESELKNLVQALRLSTQTIFTGEVLAKDVPKYLNMLSIYVALSKRESFGVAVLEASACSKPVIVSNVGGLPEIVEDAVTGFIVAAKNPKETLIAIEKLLVDIVLRKKMGEAGRKRVKSLYNWDNNVQQMIEIYMKIVTK